MVVAVSEGAGAWPAGGTGAVGPAGHREPGQPHLRPPAGGLQLKAGSGDPQGGRHTDEVGEIA